MEVRLHPYGFKWRLRSFNGLLVMILRYMGNARELDGKTAQSASKIEELEKKLDALKSKEKKIETKKEASSLQKQVTQQVKKIKKEIRSFCKTVEKELKDFKKSDINDYTLLYRGAKYLRELAKILIASKGMNEKSREQLKKQIEEEMKSVGRKATSLELQAKHVERKIATTVVFSQISPLGKRWIEGRVRRKAIEVNQIYKILKSNKGRNLPRYFEKMIGDIYEIGRNTNILMKRLNATFNSVKTKLKDRGITYHELDKTQNFFISTFKGMGSLGKRLHKEIKDQARQLNKDLGKVEKEGNIIELYSGIEEVKSKAA